MSLALFASVILLLPGVAAAMDTTTQVGVIDSDIAVGAVNYLGHSISGGTAQPIYAARILSADFANVTYVGDAQLQDPAALAHYDVLVAPRVLALTSPERIALRQYVAAGGGLVEMFGMGRWDYSASRTPYPYMRLIDTWKFPRPASYSLAWEWGEVSEVYQVSFVNDPLTYGGYSIVPTAGVTHPILQQTEADIGGPVRLDVSRDDYNELVSLMPRNHTVTPLLYYSGALTNVKATPADGTLAGWATQYYAGRSVCYGFQLLELARAGNLTAKRLIVDSTAWAAGATGTAAPVGKSVALSGGTSYTSGRFSAKNHVANTGPLQLWGTLRVDYYDGTGRRYRGGSVVLGLPTTGVYTLSGAAMVLPAGRCRAKLTYTYWDYDKGGLTTAVRWFTRTIVPVKVKLPLI